MILPVMTAVCWFLVGLGGWDGLPFTLLPAFFGVIGTSICIAYIRAGDRIERDDTRHRQWLRRQAEEEFEAWRKLKNRSSQT
jgi:hypothetical protein